MLLQRPTPALSIPPDGLGEASLRAEHDRRPQRQGPSLMKQVEHRGGLFRRRKSWRASPMARDLWLMVGTVGATRAGAQDTLSASCIPQQLTVRAEKSR
jgi:hypothetical protein